MLAELYRAIPLNDGQDLADLQSHIRILESQVMADQIRLHALGVLWTSSLPN
jgi:hypothetical protein